MAFLLAAATTGFAQEREFSAGWRLLHINGTDGEDGLNMPLGWYMDVALPLTPMLSIVGDIGGNYKSEDETEVIQGISFTGSADADVHSFLGGIRLSARNNPRFVPFGQVLFGAARASVDIEATATVGGQTLTFDESESETEAAMTLGGGVNVSAGSLAVRVQAEWLKILADDSGNAFRFAVGVVIPF